MKKALSVFLTLALLFTVSYMSAAAAKDKTHGNNSSTKKEFRAELNEQKKELQAQKEELGEQLEALEAEYDALVEAGDAEAANALMEEITALKEKISGLKSQIKETINERYMVVKSLYSEEELQQFENAAELIEQMYEDAYALGAGSVTVNNNLIKFDAPPYIKGSRTLIPVRAITEQLGAEVVWDEETQTVSIIKDNVTIELTIGSQTVFIDGSPVDLDVSPEITCARTFVPLRFIAETLGLAVTWDGDNEIIDLDDGTPDDGTPDDGTPDDGTPDDGTPDDGTTDDVTGDAA